MWYYIHIPDKRGGKNLTQKMKVTYNGEELSQYLYVMDGLNRNIIGDFTNTTVKVGNTTGEKFLDSTQGMRKIVMPFYINESVPNALMQIARIINVKEPKKLIFGDEPDRYYDAIADGTISFTRLEKEGNGTITWLVPDMYKHALTPKAIKETTTNEVKFTNGGNTTTPTKITATMQSDNGFIGFALNGKYYQIGKPEEVDGNILNKSELLVKGDPMPEISAGEMNKANFQVLPDMTKYTRNGSLKKESNGQFTPVFGTGTEGHGMSITYKLPNDSTGHWGAKNYTFRWHSTYGSEYMDFGSVGQICATLHDTTGKALASMTYSDMSQQKVDFNVKYHINGKEYYNAQVDKNKIDFTGHAYIIKNGDKFTFRDSANPTRTFICPEIKDSEVAYVSFAFYKWGNVKTPTFMSLVNWNFTKDFINEFQDIPNYFKAGDVVELDSETNLVKINGFKDWNKVDIGSQPLMAESGDNVFGLVVSTWAKIPTFIVEYRERWL